MQLKRDLRGIKKYVQSAYKSHNPPGPIHHLTQTASLISPRSTYSIIRHLVKRKSLKKSFENNLLLLQITKEAFKFIRWIFSISENST